MRLDCVESLGCVPTVSNGNAGVYHESLEYTGSAPLEIVGAGQGRTVLRGDDQLTGLTWLPSPKLNFSTGIYFATLPPQQRIAGVQQAFLDGTWIPEARYPNTNLDKMLKPQRTSWGDCGEGSKHGYCVDRPDAWSKLPAGVNWTGALATLSLGARYATWTRRVTDHGRGRDHGWFRYATVWSGCST